MMVDQAAADRYRIVIVGGGTAGWMAAAGLSKLLDGRDYQIELIESDEIGTVGVGEATLPHIKLFNDMLGIDEASFMRETHASFKLGIEFVGWDKPGDSYIHPFGVFGEGWGGVDFQHHWMRARLAGRTVGPLEDYSYAVQLAKRGGFELPNEDAKSIRSTFSYAYHFDAGAYADFLRRWAISRGVTRVEGKIVGVARDADSGDVANVQLERGERVVGDLFVDCSGFRSLLIGQELGVGWEDWSPWLPCDRALALPCTRGADITPYTRATAQAGGWTWRIPLQHRTGNGYVFSSSFIGEDEAARTLLGAIDGQPLGEPRLLRFRAGRRTAGWERNCVAIGLASGFLEPLESTSIFLIQAAVFDLANLMPARGSQRADSRLAAEFNRLFEIQYDRVRDFLILHYTANQRVGMPLWDHVRTMPLPDTLKHKIALFESRGAAPERRFGLFSRDSWLSVLVGQGVVPKDYDRLADALPLDGVETRLADLAQRIAASAEGMTPHAQFIAGYCPTQEAVAA